jgi:hypothetical protein
MDPPVIARGIFSAAVHRVNTHLPARHAEKKLGTAGGGDPLKGAPFRISPHPFLLRRVGGGRPIAEVYLVGLR